MMAQQICRGEPESVRDSAQEEAAGRTKLCRCTISYNAGRLLYGTTRDFSFSKMEFVDKKRPGVTNRWMSTRISIGRMFSRLFLSVT